MKRLIKKLITKFKVFRMRNAAKRKALDAYVTSPNKFIQASKEIDCICKGHLWDHDFDPKAEMSKPLKKRTYCKHCGVYYHEHSYKN